MKNILVLTPIYPADDVPKDFTPVVHYFTKEWVKVGYNVLVINYPSNFPKLITSVATIIEPTIKAFVGHGIRTNKIVPKEYTIDNVYVKCIPMRKLIPHSRYGNREKEKAVSQTISFCNKKAFIPDVIISHWANPCLEIMAELKKEFKSKTCYIEHSPGTDILNLFNKKQAKEIISKIDIIGFRSNHIKNMFCKLHDYKGKFFMCYSGIPEEYICNDSIERTFDKINTFIYVGTLIRRKYPSVIIPAVYNAVDNKNFEITYIGTGGEEKSINRIAHKLEVIENVKLLGRQERNKVVEMLKQHDVFIMISENETYGLVYLEAMAVGCITIASKREGFDGIIKHGYNGFLCEAGNQVELEKLINEIRSMPSEKLQEISRNAITTAKTLTDKKVALEYINNVIKL